MPLLYLTKFWRMNQWFELITSRQSLFGLKISFTPLVFVLLELKLEVVVGSSMGGWIALHLAIIRSKRVCGLVGIASAPDFLERKLQKLTSEELETLSRDKVLSLKTEYECVLERCFFFSNSSTFSQLTFVNLKGF